MDPVEDIRSKLSITEVMSPYVEMKKSGRNFKALCPFHQEKSPSFIISPDKGLAYCFGCRKGGDIFACIQELENVDFPTALKMLAEKAGITIKQQNFSPEQKNKKDRILSCLQKAQQFFQKQLNTNPEAKQYLANRGFTEKECQRFGLGFAPKSFHELTNTLQKKGFSSKELVNAGLSSQKEVGDSNSYDRFRDRIIFPIHSPLGKIIAFGGRTLSSDEGVAKYLNSPETESYHKGNTLYCFHMAKKIIREKNRAIIVEGYFDALSAHIHGYLETVASLGTALTENQLKLIGRFTENILFAFDADSSGQTAASRSIEIAQRLGYNISIIRIPNGKDPDEAIRKAPEEWEKAISKAIKAMDYEFEKAFSSANKNQIDGKKKIVKQLLPVIIRIPNAIEREFYMKKLAFDVGSSLKSIFQELNKYQEKNKIFHKNTVNEKKETLKEKQVSALTRAEYLFGILISFPKHIESIETHIKPDFFEDPSEKDLYKKLIDYYNQADKKNQDEILGEEESKKKKRLQILGLYAEEKCKTFESESEIKNEITTLCQHIRSDYKKRSLQEISLQLSKNQSNDQNQDKQNLLKKYQKILNENF